MIQSGDPRKKKQRRRLLVLGLGVLLIFTAYLIHLFSLQIVETLIWKDRALAVTRRSESLPPQRGRIWDRNMDNPLALNIDSFAVTLVPAELSPMNPSTLARDLARVLQVSEESLLEKIPIPLENLYQPVELKNAVSLENVIEIAENNESYPGVYWSSKPYRWYNAVGSIAHVHGYLGTITTEELQILYNQGYGNTSHLGKSGIEKAYDSILRGKEGLSYRTVDVRGRKLEGGENIIPPENGLDLILTIDQRIQILAEQALGPRKGSVVVLNPATGEILSMVSYPSFNPNDFDKPGHSNFNTLSLNTDFPFLNRSLQSVYPPASSFKIIMAAAILGTEAIDLNKKIRCRGVMTLGDREFWCHKKSGHGLVNFKEALVESCNIYFGTVGVDYLGIDTIFEYAKAFGLGGLTEVDIDGEVVGNVPNPAWKMQVHNTPWTGGDTLNVSIGQGFLTVTPLQMANLMAGIVNGGVIYRPRLLKEVRHPENNAIVVSFEPEILRTVSLLDEDDYKILRQALRSVVTDGTARWALYTKTVDVAGKTGTGEVSEEEHWHSWFVSFGPYAAEDPRESLVVVVMVEATNTWDWWAPKAADIIYEGIFSDKDYKEVIEDWRRRKVWWSWDTKELPSPGEPFEENTEEEEGEGE